MRAWLLGMFFCCWLWGVGAEQHKPASQAQAKAEAEVWTGWVSWVMDGDTVLVVRPGQKEPVRLRLDAMDAPETCQPGGPEARDAMIALALRKPVQVQTLGHDSYGRDIGRLSVDGLDLGAEMVRSGRAWAYRFRTGRGPYAALQRQAQQEKRGVFAGRETPMSPALFRKLNGRCLTT
jgi:micrococcal nuclease